MYRLIDMAMQCGASPDQISKAITARKREKKISEMEKAIAFVMKEYNLPYCKAKEICLKRRDELLVYYKMQVIKAMNEYGFKPKAIPFNVVMAKWAEEKIELSFTLELYPRNGKLKFKTDYNREIY